MNTREQIKAYFDAQPEPKRSDLLALHRLILKRMPRCRVWFMDGRDDTGKIVSNPNVGYGLRTIRYANGQTKEFYRIGLSANTTGISVYVLGLKDKKHLAQTYGKRIGKASVSGYCIKFRNLDDIDLDALQSALQCGIDEADG